MKYLLLQGSETEAGVTLPLRAFLKLNGPIGLLVMIESLTSLRDVYAAVCNYALECDYAVASRDARIALSNIRVRSVSVINYPYLYPVR